MRPSDLAIDPRRVAVFVCHGGDFPYRFRILLALSSENAFVAIFQQHDLLKAFVTKFQGRLLLQNPLDRVHANVSFEEQIVSLSNGRGHGDV